MAPRREDQRRSSTLLRAMAAASALLGIVAMAGALGLFSSQGGRGAGVSPFGQDVSGGRSTLATNDATNRGGGGGDDDEKEQERHQQLRRTESTDETEAVAASLTHHEQIVAAAAAAAAADPSLSSTASGGVDPTDPFRNCILRPATLSPTDLDTPVLAASYPGSGSRMLRHLIEALTGVATGDEFFRNTRRAVAIKTHYPHNHGSPLDFGWVHEITGAILLLRNPRDALPSFCNHLYERKHGMTDHSQKAPVEDWVKWRNLEFRKQLAWWKATVVHWVERFPSERRLVLTYEGLTGKAMPGSKVLSGGRIGSVHKLARFLSNSVKGLNVVPQREMHCVWYKVVKYDEAEHEEGGVTFKSRREEHPGGRSERPYAEWQLREMMEAFRTIKKKFPNEGDIVAVMESYEEEVGRNLQMHSQAAKTAAVQPEQQQVEAQEKAGGDATIDGKR